MTRREVILAAAAALGFNLPGTQQTLVEQSHAASEDPSAPLPDALSAFEREDLLAFGEVLVQGRPLSSAQREYLADHIALRAIQGGGYYLDLYRSTVSLLRQLAGKRFATLDGSERVALVARHRLAISDVRPEEYLGAFPEDMRAVRTRAVPDLIGGYYASPEGWAVVGYTTFPGRCGDLARYTGAEP